MERPSGIREMQTFRKLPITMPTRKKKNGITVSTVPQAGRRLNAARGSACRMANGYTISSGSEAGKQQLQRQTWLQKIAKDNRVG